MAKIIDYYFSPVSPWTYLGHGRFTEIARRHGATVAPKPVDYGRIFPLSGGLPVAKRPPQRQAYRLVELARWRDYLGVPMHIQPKYFPYDTRLATLVIIAAGDADKAMRLAGAFLRGCWAEERNMADEAEIAAVIRGARLDSSALLKQANAQETASRYEAFTDEAIARQVFGAPTYVYKDELFWGQDRLEFLDRALASG
ncbi:MAG: 2-hydroxychromene-2-carboxylate isomerase [Betaproteobacteria bacterium]|nr:2-hydroxychromene-2-carboxylate isomerase [Betaproteobacteria bacterium]